ncbi:efflux RND transporter periplasmic adaptor subunit [Rhizobium halophytocola]|nr:HlyD family efflux transporter periplasmic adaptor subunit [Rhizobium halophytocola]
MRSYFPACLAVAVLAPNIAWAGVPFDLATSDTAALSAINCTIKPLHVVEVSSPVRGIAAKVFVRPGSQVKEGDPLIQLDTEMAEADLRLATGKAQADATLKAAIINRDGLAQKVARMAKAAAQNAVSTGDYEAAVLEQTLAGNAVLRETQQRDLAALEQARAQMLIDKSTIRSPVAGRVGEDVIDPGEAVDNNHVATIYVNQPLRIEAYVPAPALHGFLARKSVSAQIGEADGAPIPLTMDYVSPVADLASNTVSVFFTLNQASVLPGSKCLIFNSPPGGDAAAQTSAGLARRAVENPPADMP